MTSMQTLVVIAALVGIAVGKGARRDFSWPSAKGLCRAHGDTHWNSYDDAHFTYQVPCTYILSDVTCNGCRAVVEAKNEEIRDGITAVESATVRIGGYVIMLDSKVRVNGDEKVLPYGVPSLFKIMKGPVNKKIVIVKTHCGLTVKYFHHKRSVRVFIVKKCGFKAKGICGSYDGNRYNDYLTSDNINVKFYPPLYRNYRKVTSFWQPLSGEDEDMCTRPSTVCSLTYDNMQALKEQLKADEGEHNSIYLDNYNRPCFGYGYIIRPKDPEFNLPIGMPVSAERINEALEGRLYMTIRQLQKWVLNCPNGVNNCDQWPVVATSVLTNMMYDLGGRKMKNKFKALRNKVCKWKFNAAANIMENSVWYVKSSANGRSARLVDEMRNIVSP